MRGRGSFRGTQRGRDRDRHPQQNTTAGPLMTNHLRDIDIEMEILKRKREMIQQEQELLNREREFSLQRQYDLDSPNSYSQSSRSGHSSNFYRQQGNKRQAVEIPPPRRFEPQERHNPPPRMDPWERNIVEPPKIFPKPRNYQNTPKPQPLLTINVDKQYRPQNSKPSQEFQQNRTKSFPARRDFNPTKITKPKARSTYIHKPATEESGKNSENDFILRPDVTPSTQVYGRLELALGVILKDVKLGMLESPTASIANSIKKMVKKIIRHRLRIIMMNKVVLNVVDIVAQYREVHPIETDAELADLCKQAQAYNLNNLCTDTDDPRKYLKIHTSKLLSKKLDDIFDNMKKLFANKASENANKVLELMDDVPDIDDTSASATTINDVEVDGAIALLSSKQAKAESYRKLIDALLEQRLPTIIQQYKSIILTLILTNKDYFCEKAKIEEKAMDAACELVIKKYLEDNEKAPKPDVIIVENTNPVIDISDDSQIETDNSNNQNLNGQPANPQNGKDVPETISSTSSKESAQNTVAKSRIQASKTPGSKTIDYPYFVKLIGRPELPSRKDVYDFLEQFKPASIKKHKTVGNLLVLGFNDEHGYNKLLENDGIAIGENTLIIKASEKVNNTPQKVTPVQNNQTTEKQSPVPQLTSPADINHKEENGAIDPVFDKEVSDLLCRIRNSEEGISELIQDSTSRQELKMDIGDNGDNSTADGVNLNKVPLEPNLEAVERNIDDNNSSFSKELESTKDTKDTKDTGANDENVTDKSISTTDEKSSKDIVEDQKEKSIMDLVDNQNIKNDNIVTPDTVNAIIDKNISQNNGTKAPTDISNKFFEEDKNAEADDKTEVPSGIIEEKDPKASLIESGRATPKRSSARLATATPISITTRRASRLAQNN